MSPTPSSAQPGNGQAPTPHPELDKFKAWLASLPPDERQKTLRLLAQVVKQQMEASDAGHPT